MAHAKGDAEAAIFLLDIQQATTEVISGTSLEVRLVNGRRRFHAHAAGFEEFFTDSEGVPVLLLRIKVLIEHDIGDLSIVDIIGGGEVLSFDEPNAGAGLSKKRSPILPVHGRHQFYFGGPNRI